MKPGLYLPVCLAAACSTPTIRMHPAQALKREGQQVVVMKDGKSVLGF
jgi:hypothetical protein